MSVSDVSFRIHIENRFKLNKNLHKLREVHTEGGATEQDVRILENAEVRSLFYKSLSYLLSVNTMITYRLCNCFGN